MEIQTAQQAQRLFEDYKNTEIIFTKDIIKVLKMDPRKIYIKSAGSQWPCIINSTSFLQAKIILGTAGGAFQALSKKNPAPINLRFSFYQNDGQLLNFFVSGKVEKISPYMNNKDLAVITLQYTQRPPDDLIFMIGHLLDANQNFIRRKEDRILITQDSLRRLNLQRKETIVIIQNIPRHCILQDISFGGAKVILLGLAQFLMNKDVILKLEFRDPNEEIEIKGTIVASVFVQGRKDIFSASIKFDESSISLAYKLRINHYLTTMRKDELKQNTLRQQEVVEANSPVQNKQNNEQTIAVNQNIASSTNQNLTNSSNSVSENQINSANL